MCTTIYCDEKGFSGQNLFEDDQQTFMYSSVAIEPEHASYVVESAKRDFSLQGDELKGSNLVKSTRGRDAIDLILGQIKDDMYVVAMHKKFALACKFYEWVFEPLLSKKTNFFYEMGFHKFIGNIIYFDTQFGGQEPKQLLSGFQDYIRFGDLQSLNGLFANVPTSGEQTFLSQLKTFCIAHKATIISEFKSLKDQPLLLRWLLDLTETCLYRSLCYWSEKHGAIRVFCDSSKPLSENPELFSAMIGRDKIRSIRFMGKVHPITFNLVEPIKIVDSKKHPGIQIADVVSAAFAYAQVNKNDSYAEKWNNLFKSPMLSDYCVFPELEFIDLEKEICYINTIVFNELVERSICGKDLISEWDKMALYDS
jgi:hypothetical protein